MSQPSAVLCGICDEAADTVEPGVAVATLATQAAVHGRHYRVRFCESCFEGFMAGLRRDRMVHVLFDESEDQAKSYDRDIFGVVQR